MTQVCSDDDRDKDLAAYFHVTVLAAARRCCKLRQAYANSKTMSSGSVVRVTRWLYRIRNRCDYRTDSDSGQQLTPIGHPVVISAHGKIRATCRDPAQSCVFSCVWQIPPLHSAMFAIRDIYLI